MSLLFKMQKNLVTFSLTLILKLRIPDITKLLRNAKGYLISQNFWETRKGTWYHKTFEERGEIRKIKINLLFDYLHVHGPSFNHWRHDKKTKYKSFSEMKCWVYNVLHLVLLVKIKNIIPNNRPNGRYLNC